LAQLEVAQEGQGGLLGLALDPEFEANGYLYVYHTYRHEPLDASGGRGLRNRVVRLKTLGSVAENPTVILDNIPGGYAHNGGRIKFGPDGRLYIATGDADVPAYAQDLNALAGKILRINKDGSIPQDNPIPGSPIYSLGHRNPLGLTWHPVTGELFATDQGPFRNDEVNRILAGANYGWPEVVGSVGLPQFRDPVILSGIETWGPSSAAFYSGDALPLEWRGRLSLSMLSGQRIVWLDLRPPEYQSIQGRGSLYGRRFGRIGDIIQGPDGNLYFSTNNLDGRGQPREGDDLILRIIPVNGLLGFLPTDWTDSP
jgi:glucose/arabinose dehydrogenase